MALIPALAALAVLAAPRADALDRQRYFYSDVFTAFFSSAAAPGGGTVFAPRREGASSGQSFVEPKPAGTTRLFVVGGSIANIFLSTRKDPGTRLDRVLARAFPGRRFEVIDCGMAGYDSYRESLVLEEVLAHAPDAVILMTGNNEAYGEGAVNAPLRGLFRAANRFAAVRSLRAALLARRVRGRPRMPDGGARARGLWLSAFEENLAGMVRAAKAAGVPVVLCPLPVNSADIPPEVDPPLGDSEFREAYDAFERGDLRAALAGFRRSAADAPERAVDRYYLGKAAEALGLFAEARGAYAAAVDRDRLVRASPSVDAAIRRVARGEGAAVADIEAAFSSAAPHGLLGRKLFLDDVHWHLEYNRVADGAVLAALLGLGRAGWPGLGPSSGWSPAALAAAERFCAADQVRFDADLRRQIGEQRLLLGVSAVLDAAAAPRAPGSGAAALSPRALAYFGMVAADDRALLEGLGARRDWVLERLSGNAWSADRAALLRRDWPEILRHADRALHGRA